jgi:hypothetical protein
MGFTTAGGTMRFIEGTHRDPAGDIVTHSRLQPGQPRQDLERKLFPSVVVGLFGWHRAHSQGASLGAESAAGIRYAPPEVHQPLQRLDIERHLRELLSLKPAEVELWLTTVTTAHARTLRLKEIRYRLQALRGLQERRLIFEARIGVSDSRDQPCITVQATPFGALG